LIRVMAKMSRYDCRWVSPVMAISGMAGRATLGVRVAAGSAFDLSGDAYVASDF